MSLVLHGTSATCFTDPGGTISENGDRNASHFLVEPVYTVLALCYLHSSASVLSWSLGHVAVTVQGQLKGPLPTKILCERVLLLSSGQLDNSHETV